MGNKGKYYVVWIGHLPGVYSDWELCKKQIAGFEGAKYKSFPSKAEAEEAFQKSWKQYLESPKTKGGAKFEDRPASNFIAVDAACSGNPGLLEYRGVWGNTQKVIFHQGPFQNGTNNIGEFLAIVHALALQVSKNTNYPIYSDSANAIVWLKKKKCNTKLIEDERNASLFEMIDRAEQWLSSHTWHIPVYKWETAIWGEIPADFGRK